MTIVSRTGPSSATPAEAGEPTPGPSVSALRARRLLAGGLLGAHVIALICVGIFLVRDGVPGLVSAALGAALVILFYTIGKTVQVRWADAPATTIFRVSMVSYFVRVGGLAALLAGYLRFADETTRLLGVPLAVTTVATVIGWLVGELIVFSRLRIPNFDDPPTASSDGENSK